MDRKTLPCLQNASQHVAIYLQQFPSYLKQNCKKNYFYVPRPSFLVFPGDAPVAITQNVTWMKIQFSAFQTLCSMLPSVLNSFSVFKSASTKSRGFYVPQPIFLPVDAPTIVQLCLTTYKCLHGLAPPHLIRFCTPLSAVAGRTHLRSADQHKLFVPRTYTSTFGPRAFSSSSPLFWNALPPSFVTQPSASASSDNPWKLIFSTVIVIDCVSLLFWFCTFIDFFSSVTARAFVTVSV